MKIVFLIGVWQTAQSAQPRDLLRTAIFRIIWTQLCNDTFAAILMLELCIVSRAFSTSYHQPNKQEFLSVNPSLSKQIPFPNKQKKP